MGVAVQSMAQRWLHRPTPGGEEHASRGGLAPQGLRPAVIVLFRRVRVWKWPEFKGNKNSVQLLLRFLIHVHDQREATMFVQPFLFSNMFQAVALPRSKPWTWYFWAKFGPFCGLSAQEVSPWSGGRAVGNKGLEHLEGKHHL